MEIVENVLDLPWSPCGIRTLTFFPGDAFIPDLREASPEAKGKEKCFRQDSLAANDRSLLRPGQGDSDQGPRCSADQTPPGLFLSLVSASTACQNHSYRLGVSQGWSPGQH